MRNKFETRVSNTLEDRFQYEALKLPYTLQCNYLPDWVDVEAKEIIEGKGRFDAADRRKHLAIKEQYPDWKVTIIFQNAERTISKTSKTRYRDWCDRHGIEWRQLK